MNGFEPNEERLSAYLDGELDGDALEQVERRLQSDDEFRRCLDDYRALRESIQQLPRHALGAEFAERVLKSIEVKNVCVETPPFRPPSSLWAEHLPPRSTQSTASAH